LLTIHLSINLVNDQLDAQFFYFIIRLLQSSTCFEQHRAHHQEIQLYQYDIWYMSLSVGDRLVCRPDGHLHWVTFTRYHIDTVEFPDDEHLHAQNM